MPAGQLHPNARAMTAPSSGGDDALRDRAGDGDAPHRQQLLDVKLQADAEHEEDDADLGQLLGDIGVGHEAGRVRTDERAGQQVADDGRQARALGEVAEDEGRGEAAGQRQDQIEVVQVSGGGAVPPLPPRACKAPSPRAARGLRRWDYATSASLAGTVFARAWACTRLYHQEVRRGVRIAVTITDAAT